MIKVPEGFLLSGMHCGIKKKKLDLGLIACKDGAAGIGLFTRNVNPSYSVTISKKHIKNTVKAVIVNSGNANCFTDKKDLGNTLKACESLARYLNIKKENVLICSTGIIGKRLPFFKINRSIPALCANLGRRYKEFAGSILTTDNFEKVSFKEVKLKDSEIKILGFCKGSGMIHPNLATMLSFILTDVKMNKSLLRKIFSKAVGKSFNSISVDRCMSTNDTVLMLSSSKKSGLEDSRSINKFQEALEYVCRDLAKMIVKDAEGSTKFIELEVEGAKTEKEAKAAFQSIAGSLIFKAAMYGGNPNWGRIISTLGQVNIKVREDKFEVKASSLHKRNVKIRVNMGRGKFNWRGWFSDISPEYVKINAGHN